MKRVILFAILFSLMPVVTYAEIDVTAILQNKKISAEVKNKIVQRHHRYFDELYNLYYDKENKLHKVKRDHVEKYHRENKRRLRNFRDHAMRCNYAYRSEVMLFEKQFEELDETKHHRHECEGNTSFTRDLNRIEREYQMKKDKLDREFESDVTKLLKI